MADQEKPASTVQEAMSKYGKDYKGAQDWVTQFMREQCSTPSGKPIMNLASLHRLAKANGLDGTERRYGSMNPGHQRMNVGNRLRSIAVRKSGLNDVNGKFHKADAEFIDMHMHMADQEKAPSTLQEAMSKYGKDYMGAQDWVAQFIRGQCSTPTDKTIKEKDDNGKGVTQTVPGKPVMNLDILHRLAKANGLDDTESLYGSMNPGHQRMNVGNSLRSIAARQSGLKDVNGKFHKADAEFIAKQEKSNVI